MPVNYIKGRYAVMVKHMIIWKLKEEYRDRESRKREIKDRLEGLVGKIPGLLEMHIHYDPMEGSAGDVFMDSTFEDAAALAVYQKHFLHLEIANNTVIPVVEQRLSFDYEV